MATKDKISSLVAMGFAASDAEGVLQRNGGDVEQAVGQLVSSPQTDTTASSSASPPHYSNQQDVPTVIAEPVYQATPPLPDYHQQGGRPVQYVTFKHDRRGVCYWILNILWILLGGWHMFLSWFFTGLILCMTCVCFPCGWQVIKISLFLLFPFGLSLIDSDDEIEDVDIRCCCKCWNCLLNVFWALTVGWILALQSIITGIALCLTIIGIPFGWQCFKMAFLCFRPFGLRISAEELTTVAIQNEPERYRAI